MSAYERLQKKESGKIENVATKSQCNSTIPLREEVMMIDYLLIK